MEGCVDTTGSGEQKEGCVSSEATPYFFKRAPKHEPVCTTFRKAVVLSAQLFLYGFFVLFSFPLFWLPPKGEIVIFGNNTDPFILRRLKVLVAIDLQFYLPLPIMFCFYICATKLESLLCLLSLLPGYILGQVSAHFIRNWGVFLASRLAPFISFLVYLKLRMPKGSRIPHQFVKFVLILCVGLFFIPSVNMIPATGDGWRMLLLGLWFPFVREVWYSLARSCTRYLALDASIAGESVGLVLNRATVWGYFLPIQITIACVVRLFMTNFDDPLFMALSVIHQSVMELFFRLSLNWRDSRMRNLSESFRSFRSSKRHCTAIVSPEVLQHSISLKVSGDGSVPLATDNELSERKLVSMFILGEMMAEYAAIILIPILIVFKFGDKIFSPFQYYKSVENVFTVEHVDLGPIVLWILYQLLSEIGVDILCSVLEMRKGIDLVNTWKTSHKSLWLFFGIASLLASVCVVSLSNTDDLSRCRRRDMCYCSNGKGLREDGLRQLYCMKLYPLTNGVPPS